MCPLQYYRNISQSLMTSLLFAQNVPGSLLEQITVSIQTIGSSSCYLSVIRQSVCRCSLGVRGAEPFLQTGKQELLARFAQEMDLSAHLPSRGRLLCTAAHTLHRCARNRYPNNTAIQLSVRY